ncbi:MAG: argininosuccinate lyase [Clostridia bacterium]|nr:argininosuccinate lyase [Clostridia bacterium]
MRERLTMPPSEMYYKYLIQPYIDDDNRLSFYNQIQMNLTHAMMLSKQGIISDDTAKALVRCLLDMNAEGPSSVQIWKEEDDYYANFERNIINRVGKEIGGQLHTGRSRNDLGSTLARMNVRDNLVNMIPLVLDLQHTLLEFAEKYADQVMTGYTHMQPAQPITLGYYFSAIAEALERDVQRLLAAYDRMNYCTLGSGASFGTSFPLDRQITAKDLGFYGPVHNTMDAVVTRDYLLEIMADFSILASTLSRMATDMYQWTMDEFAYMEVSDSMAASSSIMPQKKNPAALEYIRAKSAHLAAGYVDIFMALKGTAFIHSREGAGETLHYYWDASLQLEAILHLMKDTLLSSKFKPQNMERVNQNFCTVTELADALVKEEGLPFRSAHGIVGKCVQATYNNGLKCTDITKEVMEKASLDEIGRVISWDTERIQEALSARRSVEGKDHCYGAPSPAETLRMAAEMREHLADFEGGYAERTEALDAAKKALFDKAEQYCG